MSIPNEAIFLQIIWFPGSTKLLGRMMDKVTTPDATNSLIRTLFLGVIHIPSHLQFFLLLSLLFILLNATKGYHKDCERGSSTQLSGRRNRGSECEVSISLIALSLLFVTWLQHMPSCWETREGENGTLTYFRNQLNSPRRSTGISSVEYQTLGIRLSQTVARILQRTIFLFPVLWN